MLVAREMIGYCGYSCHLCAARSEDAEVRQKLVDGWRKLFGHEHYTAENVRCDGCKSDGRVADQSCKARSCARERGVESCAACEDFPCDRMRHLMASREGLLIFCVRGSTTGRRVVADGVYCLGRGVCAIRSRDDRQEFTDLTVAHRLDRLLGRTTGSVFPNLTGPTLKQFSVVAAPGQS